MDASCQHIPTELTSTETQVSTSCDSKEIQVVQDLEDNQAQTDVLLKRPCNCHKCCQKTEGQNLLDYEDKECLCEGNPLNVEINYCYLVPYLLALTLAVSVFGAATADFRPEMKNIALL